MRDVTPLQGYEEFLREVKERIHIAQVRAAVAVSRELMALYWQIGQGLTERQEQQGWGRGRCGGLPPTCKSLSQAWRDSPYRNLYRMRAFYLAYPDEADFVTQAVSQIPWGHNITIFQKVKDTDLRLWYAAQALNHGWSRAVLEHQIENRSLRAAGQGATNFSRRSRRRSPTWRSKL